MARDAIRHGTTTTYSHNKCRCEECRAAVAAYNRKRQQALRDGTWVPGRYKAEVKPCSIEGCVNKARYSNPLVLCTGHYLQRMRGEPFHPLVKRRRVKDGFKQCSRCEEVLPVSAFSKQSVSSAGNPRIQSACRACLSIYTRARKYGLTFEEMKQLLTQPCSGCGAEVKGREQHVDHCHDTGRVRGILCHNCNTVLTVHMTPEKLRRLADYLER